MGVWTLCCWIRAAAANKSCGSEQNARHKLARGGINQNYVVSHGNTYLEFSRAFLLETILIFFYYYLDYVSEFSIAIPSNFMVKCPRLSTQANRRTLRACLPDPLNALHFVSFPKG